MRTQAECYEALLAKKTLISKLGNKVKLVGGMLQSMADGDDGTPMSYSFSDPSHWSVLEQKVHIKLEDAIAAMRAGKVLSPGNGCLYRIHALQFQVVSAKATREMSWTASDMSLGSALQGTSWTEVDERDFFLDAAR